MDDKYLVVKGSSGSGLGDRLRALLVGLVYARVSGRRVFVDWSDGVCADPGINSFPLLFDTRGTQFAGDLPEEKTSILPAAWRGRLQRTFHDVYVGDGNTTWDRQDTIRRYSIDMTRVDYPDRVLVMWDFDQLNSIRQAVPGLFESDDEQILCDMYHQNLVPVPEVVAAVEEYNRGLSRPAIGVHVRAAREWDDNKGKIHLHQYCRTLDRLMDRTRARSIFVATDNAAVQDRLLQRYGKARARGKWFAAPGESLHRNESCPDPLGNARDALIELGILAECDHLVYPAASSFGQTAALISNGNRNQQYKLFPERSSVKRLLAKLNNLLRSDIPDGYS